MRSLGVNRTKYSDSFKHYKVELSLDIYINLNCAITLECIISAIKNKRIINYGNNNNKYTRVK